MMKAILTGALVMLLGFSSFADWDVEKPRIDFLISSVEQLDATFIRDGAPHTAEEAAKHLRRKLKWGLGMPGAPKKEDVTAELFITEIATKSGSGRPYMIQFPNGKTVEAQEWLFQQLAHYHN